MEAIVIRSHAPPEAVQVAFLLLPSFPRSFQLSLNASVPVALLFLLQLASACHSAHEYKSNCLLLSAHRRSLFLLCLLPASLLHHLSSSASAPVRCGRSHPSLLSPRLAGRCPKPPRRTAPRPPTAANRTRPPPCSGRPAWTLPMGPPPAAWSAPRPAPGPTPRIKC
jgi:hypothetical protein